ncbi:NTP transferase domain-containing protein [Motiliproteus sp.]|uniref:phosphocholine cytidylyltransferase family protein n=1 Tax=Motiliproteus sp. TaxID=1898955 RepID=UPI003BAA5594
MKAIILAAGQGTRLRPYTSDRPKCMVSLAGRPMLHRQLETLREAGVQDITLVGGYMADRIDAPDTEMVINPRFSTTNMVATLFCAKDRIDTQDDLLICYGDIVYEKKVLDSILSSDAEISVAADQQWRRLWQLRMDDPLSDAETFVMDSDNRVVELGKPPQGYEEVQAQYIGLIRVRKDCVKRFIKAYDDLDRDSIYDGKDFDNMYMTSFIQYLIDSKWCVEARLVDNGWLEVDTAGELELYNKKIADGSLKDIVNI